VVADAKFGRLAVGWEGEAELRVGVGDRRSGGRGVLIGGSGRWGGDKDKVVDGELLDLIEAGAGEVGGGVAGVELERGKTSGLGVGPGDDGLVLRVAELLDGEVKGSRVDGLEGNGDVDGGWLVGWLPLGLNRLSGGGVERDGVDAGGAGRAEHQVVLTTGYEEVAVGQLPVFAWRVLKLDGWTFEGVEAPEAADGAGDGAAV